MPDTAALGLPLLVAEQAQKHVTHNEALSLLDALVRTQVVDRDLAAPPGSPMEGAIYIPASGATGDWSAWDFNLAYYVGGAWQKIVPKVGWLAYVIDEDKYYKFEGAPTYWAEFASGGSIGVGDITGVTSERILARKSGGSGVAEEATLSEVLDFIGSAVQGDILYRGASSWAKLAAGTAGHFLKTQGAAADPVWAAVPGGGAVRELLSADRDYYVRTDGSDSNDGLSDSSSGAFLTIQKAIDTIAALDINAKTVTVHVGNGTYTDGVTLKSTVGFAALGNLVLVGDESTPSNVLLSTTSEHAVMAVGIFVVWQVKGFKLQTTTSGSGVACGSRSTVYLGAMDYGDCAGDHILADGGYVVIDDDYDITGGATRHYDVNTSGFIDVLGVTVTLTGTPAFSWFVQTANLAGIRCSGCTYSGAATGTRYRGLTNSLMQTSGGGETFFPGDAAGTTSGDAVYN